MGDPLGVVAMIHGSSADMTDEAIVDYLSRVMRGRRPNSEQVQDLRRRYDAIGGVTSLLDNSRRQVATLAAELGAGFEVALGAKHSPPFVAEAVAALSRRGCNRVVGIALAPHESVLTTSQYAEAGAAAADAAGLEWTMVRSWHVDPHLVELWASLLRDALDLHGGGAEVRFSAHSLPMRADDPYPHQVRQTAEAVAGSVGLREESWRVVYQSVPPGVDPSSWLGPDLGADWPAGETVVVAPVGFVSDHLEVLYDIDVQAGEQAMAAGSRLIRTRMPNDDPRLARAMASAVRAAA